MSLELGDSELLVACLQMDNLPIQMLCVFSLGLFPPSWCFHEDGDVWNLSSPLFKVICGATSLLPPPSIILKQLLFTHMSHIWLWYLFLEICLLLSDPIAYLLGPRIWIILFCFSRVPTSPSPSMWTPAGSLVHWPQGGKRPWVGEEERREWIGTCPSSVLCSEPSPVPHISSTLGPAPYWGTRAMGSLEEWIPDLKVRCCWLI